jgi:putative ABC transport system permease protein
MMNLRTLARRSLRFYFRAHLGVLAGATLAAAVLIGALVVGDSVRESLLEKARSRIADKTAALNSGDRFFTQNFVTELVPEGNTPAANPFFGEGKPFWFRFTETGTSPDRAYSPIQAALELPATIVRQDGTASANRIQVFGVSPLELRKAWHNELLNSSRRDRPPPEPDFGGATVWLNSTLARQLNAKEGDQVVLRLHKPSALSRDAVITPRDDVSVALRLTVAGIMPAYRLGDFSFVANQTAALNAFVNLPTLSAAAGIPGRANVLLAEKPAIQHYGLNLPKWRQALGQWPERLKMAALLPNPTSASPMPVADYLAFLSNRVSASWSLADAELDVHAVEPAPKLTGGEPVPAFAELTTRRIFLEPTTVAAALTTQSASSAVPVLTYLVNSLTHGDDLAPYSMVAAAGAPYTPADLKDDEIVVNEWLAADLKVKPGDTMEVAYYRVDAGTQLVEHTNTFRVRSIVPLRGLHADRTLMPEFPGLTKAESTRDWDAGFDLVHPIRDQDEAYWKQWRGTPKAFINLAAGQKMWANRFGDLTAIRWFRAHTRPPTTVDAQSPSPLNGERAGATLSPAVIAIRDAIATEIRKKLDPTDYGLRFTDLRTPALAAAESGTGKEFGGLMVGFSFFLITSALLLTAMLFSFSLEQRATETGILLALGWEPRRVRRLLFREGFALAVLGAILGTFLGIAYAKGVLWGLTTIWRDAVNGAGLEFHVTAETLVTGILSSLVVAAFTLWLTLRKQAKRPARELLNEGANEAALALAESGSRWPRRWAWIASLAALGMTAAAWATRQSSPETFFGAGALLLIAGLLWVRAWLRRPNASRPTPSLLNGEKAGTRGENANTADSTPKDSSTTPPHPGPLPPIRWGGEGEASGRTVAEVAPYSSHNSLHSRPSLTALALRGLTRRPSRSLGTVALLASAAFLIIAVAANRLDANRDATLRSSGTGGFALWAESSLPVIQDLNTRKGQEFYGLDPKSLKEVSSVPFRVRDGDDASCLNLNRAQRPRLLGVKPELLAQRGAFTFTGLAKGISVTNGWLALKTESPDAKSEVIEIPAIADANSLQWALQKQLGDTLDYVDERGRPFKVRFVGAVANSILQGSVIIDEAELVKRFPGESGHRLFLLDAPAASVESLSATLTRALQDTGLEVTPATRRLDMFNAVQNTYLNTFQILGGLGLLLGSVGLGVVVLRNVFERRGELALMQAVGFERPALQRLVLVEHSALLVLGLLVGTVAALVAVLPALVTPGAGVPWGSLSLTLLAVLLNGALWTWLATRRALRGRLVDSLRAL